MSLTGMKAMDVEGSPAKGDVEASVKSVGAGEVTPDLYENERHGSWVTGVFHIITAVVGASRRRSGV